MVRVGLAVALVCLFIGAVPAVAARPGDHPKLDKKLNDRAKGIGKSRVIITLKPGWDVSTEIRKSGGKMGRRLDLINGQVVELSNAQLRKIAGHPGVKSMHWDRPTSGHMNRATLTIGSRLVRAIYGYNGAGVGVAVIDSGISAWHDDLTGPNGSGQRVTAFVDFVNGQATPYDDFGHGTHVSGIIAGNGRDSSGAYAGVAPGASLVSLKVLDGTGKGVISDVIAALDYAVTNRVAFNIRVINLSVGANITESYRTDPLTLAAKRAVDAGIVVVAAAGNRGKNAAGQPVYGGINAPGNAPWVVTVGASSTEGTPYRFDDVVAPYSSRGPTRIDYQAKPDLVAPGTGVVSLSNPSSLFYTTQALFLLNGSMAGNGSKPYLSLTGTSMAAPVVSGTIALMLQANPNLTPNLVKAILQYTAQPYPAFNPLTEGAGFLNTKGAVELARFFARATPGTRYPSSRMWGKHITWGNHRIGGGVIKPNGTAWKTSVAWGAAADDEGKKIVWGTECGTDECDNIVWGTTDEDDNIVWGTASDEADNIVWGTFAENEDDNIVWGTAADDDDNIVWGTDCGGGKDCDNIVWGTAADEADNIVWGTAEEDDNIVWGTSDDDDNIVWGTSGDEQGNIVWGTAYDEGDNIVWGTSDEQAPLFEDPSAQPVVFPDTLAYAIFEGAVVEGVVFDDTLSVDVLFEPVLTETPVIGGGI